MAAIGRRSFFGFLFGAAAAVPALPEIVEAAMPMPYAPVSRVIIARSPRLDRETGLPITHFRGIPIIVVDDLASKS